MRISRVDLNLFLVFDTVYRERNLTRAAERLHVTQPAISNALRRLRDIYQDPLFERITGGVKPTSVADSVQPGVRRALAALDQSLQLTAVFEPAQSERDFSLSMGDLAESLFLPGLLQRVEQQAPGVSLRSVSVSRHRVAAELASGSLDFAIEPPLLSAPELCSRPLLEDHYVCVMREGHPMASQPLTLSRYLSLSHLHLSSRRRGSGLIDQALAAQGERRKIALRARHYLAAPHIVSRSDLVLSAPAALALPDGLITRPLPFEIPALRLHLFWHQSREQDTASQWLRQQLLEVARESALVQQAAD